MRNRFTAGMSVTASAAAIFFLMVTAAAGQPQAYRAPRTADGKPNLNGVWQALNTANWDIEAHVAQPSPFPDLLGALHAQPAGQGVVEGDEIPYQPWALAKKKENFEKRLTPPRNNEMSQTVGDTEPKCFMPGVPRATYMPFPFQIVQTPKLVLITYEYANAARMIHLDRKPVAPNASWMGLSTGRWEGETLVVDVTDQVEQTWFDRAGNFHSDALRVTERYTPVSPDHLLYEATIDDPKVFTRPWKISMPLYRRIDRNVQLLEFRCVEFAEDFMYGHLRKQTSK